MNSRSDKAAVVVSSSASSCVSMSTLNDEIEAETTKRVEVSATGLNAGQVQMTRANQGVTAGETAPFNQAR